MLKLCGFRISNYHNKVRLALLEKGVPHEEDPGCLPSQKDDWVGRSPMGKVPIARARVRELVTHLELHMELVARRLYGAVFFGGKVSDETREQVQKDLAKGVRTLQRLAKFDPFIAGKELTLADCTAFVHLPIVSLATKLAYGADALEGVAQLKPYLKMLAERPAFARVSEDRKAASEAAKARAKS